MRKSTKGNTSLSINLFNKTEEAKIDFDYEKIKDKHKERMNINIQKESEKLGDLLLNISNDEFFII